MRYGLVALPQRDVLEAEGNSETFPGGFGVLANPQEEKEGKRYEVADGVAHRGVAFPALLDSQSYYRAWECHLLDRRWVRPAGTDDHVRYGFVEALLGWMLLARVLKSLPHHSEADFTNRSLDGRPRKNSCSWFDALPEGPSKGQEQPLAFQVLMGELDGGEPRILANSGRKHSPEPPGLAPGPPLVPLALLRMEKPTEVISLRTRASCQEPSWGGKGKRCENSWRKRASAVVGYPSS